MTSRLLAAAAMLAFAGTTLAQNTTTTTTAPAPAQVAPQPAPAPGAQTAPAATPPAATPPAGGGSQQVVVNPPAQTAPQGVPAPAPAAAAPANIQVNPGTPAQAAYPQSQPVVVENQGPPRSPMKIVLTDSLYGGGIGALVGLGVGLIEQGDYGRDVLIGTGLGLVGGAVVGGIHAYSSSTGNSLMSQRAHARDGLGTLARDRELRKPIHRVVALTFNY